MKSFLYTLTTTLLLIGCSSEKEKAKLANPASVNCTEKGGQLVLKKRDHGGEYGVCYFEDNRQCEEWALFRGNCPVGGVKVTGYLTQEGVYCAITGGTPVNKEKECRLPSGKHCVASEYYRGKC